MSAKATYSTPGEIRRAAREGWFTQPTSGHAARFVQANLVVLPRELASDFRLFCQRNHRACPLLEVLYAGDPHSGRLAPGADVTTDVPGYRVYRDGELCEERSEIADLWTDDAVAFLLGCSFTFEQALVEADLPLRHHQVGSNVPMYETNIALRPAGVFAGNMVVSMRPMPAGRVDIASQVTAAFPLAHGAPVQIANPQAIGVYELSRPEYGDPVPIGDDEVPVFWACGVTPQAVALRSKPVWMLTHSPGKMFVTDIENDELRFVSPADWFGCEH